MKSRILLCWCLVIGCVSVTGRPQNEDLYKSISTVIKNLEDTNSPKRISQDIRSKIITKRDFIQTRNKKSHLELPPEFVVSTNLHVSHDQKEPNNANFRSGRSNQLFGPSRYFPLKVGQDHTKKYNFRKVKQLFPNLASAVKNAPVVTGVRVPDDETDLVVHRGGRFINNMYVPDPIMEENSVAQVPEEVVVTAELGPNNLQFSRSGRSYQDYYNENEYTFTPLEHFEQQQQQLQDGQQLPGAVFPAQRDDFVIEMQTYQQCPECPMFSVPVPIPKYPNVLPVADQKTSDKSLIAKLADIVRPAISRARNFFKGVSDPEPEKISSRIDTFDSVPTASNNNRLMSSLKSNAVFAGLATVGIGLASYFAPNFAGSGRKFEDNTDYLLNSIDNELETLSHYSVDDALCLPRRYCDNLMFRKHLLDQYPNMKKVAAWMTDAYFENIQDEKYSHSQCNVKQCLEELLN